MTQNKTQEEQNQSGSETYTTGSFFIEQVAMVVLQMEIQYTHHFIAAGGRPGIDSYWRMYTIADSGSITEFDEDRMIYPKIKGVGGSIDDYDDVGPGGYWENFGIGTGYAKKYFSAPLTEDVQGVVLQISGSIGRSIRKQQTQHQ